MMPQAPPAALPDLAAALAWARAQLPGAEAALEGERLLLAASGASRAQLFAFPERRLEESQWQTLRAMVAARAAGTPLAYVLGRQGFWTFELEVDPAVLIPRADTELLVELALQRLPEEAAVALADLGTGSGAIALALASERPRAHVHAVDASEPALAVARRNAARLGLRNLAFHHGDWLQPLAEQRLQLIASNPPYIAEGDPHLAQGDLPYEPAAALSSGRDGLDAIRRIVAAAPDHLLANGWLLLEHGHDQGAAVRSLLTARGFADVSSERDIELRERVSLGRWPG